jgi:hypothetical protein
MDQLQVAAAFAATKIVLSNYLNKTDLRSSHSRRIPGSNFRRSCTSSPEFKSILTQHSCLSRLRKHLFGDQSDKMWNRSRRLLGGTPFYNLFIRLRSLQIEKLRPAKVEVCQFGTPSPISCIHGTFEILSRVFNSVTVV